MNWITISQFIFAIGTVLLIRKLLLNRNILNGYDLVGSFLTWLAMTLVLYQFYAWKDWIGFYGGLVQWLFWLFVIIFVGKKKIKNIIEYRKGEKSVFKMLGYRNKKDFLKRGKTCGKCFYFSRIKFHHCNFDGKETTEFSPACEHFIPIETYGVS